MVDVRTPVIVVLMFSCFTYGQNLRTNTKDGARLFAPAMLDVNEIQRQNQITKQILQRYLEQRLYPFANRTRTPVPSAEEILKFPHKNRAYLINAKQYDDERRFRDDYDDDERYLNENDEIDLETGQPEVRFNRNDRDALQVVGSERVTSFYDDDFEDCLNCIDDNSIASNRWTMPLVKLGDKRFYLGIFFKANWYRASQYCRFHGMHLASIANKEENDRLDKYIREYGYNDEHFWISGTDLAEEGTFFWMSNGRPISFENWNTGEPNNFKYDNGEEENCMELWNRDGKGFKWNDSPCSFETYFICEVA